MHAAVMADCAYDIWPVSDGELVVLHCDVHVQEELEPPDIEPEPEPEADADVDIMRDFFPSLACNDTSKSDECFSVNARMLRAYSMRFVQEVSTDADRPCVGMTAEHLYATNDCTNLRGIDKCIADSVLACDPTMRCWCVPVIIQVNPGGHDISCAQSHKAALKDSPILVHNRCAYDFITSYCDYLEVEDRYEEICTGGGSFFYAALVMFLGRTTLENMDSYEYINNK
jgi:hypothetical protein